MQAAIRAKQMMMTIPATIRPALASACQMLSWLSTSAAIFTPDANTSDGAMALPPAALAACRKLLTIAFPQVTEFCSRARKKPRNRI